MCALTDTLRLPSAALQQATRALSVSPARNNSQKSEQSISNRWLLFPLPSPDKYDSQETKTCPDWRKTSSSMLSGRGYHPSPWTGPPPGHRVQRCRTQNRLGRELNTTATWRRLHRFMVVILNSLGTFFTWWRAEHAFGTNQDDLAKKSCPVV